MNWHRRAFTDVEERTDIGPRRKTGSIFVIEMMTDMVAIARSVFGSDETVDREGARPVAVKQETDLQVQMDQQDTVALAA